MKYFINTTSQPTRRLKPVQEFYDIPVEIPTAIATRIFKVQHEAEQAAAYLRALEGLVGTRSNYDINELEVPICLQDAAPKGSPRPKKVTAAASKKKSQTKRKVIQSKPATSPLKPASSG